MVRHQAEVEDGGGAKRTQRLPDDLFMDYILTQRGNSP